NPSEKTPTTSTGTLLAVQDTEIDSALRHGREDTVSVPLPQARTSWPTGLAENGQEREYRDRTTWSAKLPVLLLFLGPPGCAMLLSRRTWSRVYRLGVSWPSASNAVD